MLWQRDLSESLGFDTCVSVDKGYSRIFGGLCLQSLCLQNLAGFEECELETLCLFSACVVL